MSRDSLTSLPTNPGDVLAGKYRVEKVLGAGGMGVVVQATHLDLDERVALKFLLPEAVESPEAAARFVREARAAVKIKSEHVARVIDVGRLETGSPYMVMEFLQGTDLNDVVQHGALPIEDAVDYLIQACDAMAEAHAAGIVHRDLKPSNLFLTRRADGSALIKVLDFGISKVAAPDAADAGLTRTSTLMGSPYYMSPEQMRSAKNVDHRTDVWALGVILYELLSGRPPFSGESLPDLLASIMTAPPHPIRALRPELPAALEAVILRALEKDVRRRFQSVGELASALIPFAPRRSRYMAERIFKISGVSSSLPHSLAPPQPAEPTLRSGEQPHDAAPPTVNVGPAGAAMTNAAWSGTQGGMGSAGKALALGAGLGLGFLTMMGIAALVLSKRGEVVAEVPSAAPARPAAAAMPSALPEPTPAPEPVASAAPAASVAPAVTATPAPSPAPPPSPAVRAARLQPKLAAPPAEPAPAPKRKNPLAIDLK